MDKIWIIYPLLYMFVTTLLYGILYHFCDLSLRCAAVSKITGAFFSVTWLITLHHVGHSGIFFCVTLTVVLWWCFRIDADNWGEFDAPV